jgi:ribonuclease Z
MKSHRKGLMPIGGAVGLVAVAILGLIRVPAIQDALVRHVVDSTLEATRDDLLEPNAMRVVLCGTGNPLADRDRADACTAVFAGGSFYLVDTGPGAWKNLSLWHIPAARLAGVMITHYHSDHIGDLGEINLQTWAQGRPGPLSVYGPPGIDAIVGGFAQAYALDEGYRIAHHGAQLMPPENWPMKPVEVTIPSVPGSSSSVSGSSTVFEKDGLKVTAFNVNHSPVSPAYGYRFDYKGRSVVISGDTARCENLVAVARGADVLIHEAQSAQMVTMIEDSAMRHGNARIAKIMRDIIRYHTTPTDAATEANSAGVAMLVLSHLGPPTPNAIAREVFMRGVSAIRPAGVILGSDGLLLTLPIGSDAIEQSTVR